jgi:hypothetical protein
MFKFLSLLIASTIVLLSGIAFAQTPTPPYWNAKYVVNYEAFYPNTSIKSHVFVELAGMDRTYSPPVTSHEECEAAAWTRMKAIAAQRNPGAKRIDWGRGWAGKCWQGSKPPEPLGWKTFAHGLPW